MSEQSESPRYDLALFLGLGCLIILVFLSQGSLYTLRMLVEALCYVLLALGLTIQWGYGGLFNVGIMGFIAAGAASTVFISFPRNADFWGSDGAVLLGWVLVKLAVGAGIIWWLAKRATLPKKLKTFLTVVAIATTYIVVTSSVDTMAREVERTAGWVGGLGLPVFVGWMVAGLVAGCIAWFVGRICLGLRSDYLAIATLGIAQIIKTFLKNADWLTHGTLTVSPLPWPIPTANEVGFLTARAGYLCLVAILVAVAYVLLQRAYHAPWGRMMRAIRDNEHAAQAMGKNVNKRRLEIFILGSVIMGIGGAVLVTFTGLFDPAGFVDLNHTFLIWVMVILGGSGNNRGAIFGAVFVYILWTMSEPVALWFFSVLRDVGQAWFDWQAPSDLDSRALQMRVFVIGFTIVAVLRTMPQGLLPERLSQR